MIKTGKIFWAVLALLVTACATSPSGLPPPPMHLGGQVLWQLVHNLCVPNQLAHQKPGPCALVSMSAGEATGYALLKDRNGVTQHLLIPTAKITGIEDSQLLAPGAENYFADAWANRDVVEKQLGHALLRTQMSVVVNSQYGRSQDQLHLHIDCLDRSVGEALSGTLVPHTGRWSDQAITLKGHRYLILWLDDAQLATTNPFKRLAQDVPGASSAMAPWTIALVGAQTKDGAAGFYLLADRADPGHGDPGSAEGLQDHACRL